MLDQLLKKQIILASTSPRRQSLMRNLGLNFDVKTREVEEIYPDDLKGKDIVLYLAELKAKAFEVDEIPNEAILVTADTIVCLNDEVLIKPANYEEAFKILTNLSGKKHEVITGVCLRSKNKMKTFFATTDVYFKKLSSEEIHHYIENYKPFDKAGAYGIQEWIGYIGIEKISGSFYNVMGLPVQRLYEELQKF